MSPQPTTERNPRDIPTAWFALLETARERGDRNLESEAVRNLERLGVIVSFRSIDIVRGVAHA